MSLYFPDGNPLEISKLWNLWGICVISLGETIENDLLTRFIWIKPIPLILNTPEPLQMGPHMWFHLWFLGGCFFNERGMRSMGDVCTDRDLTRKKC